MLKRLIRKRSEEIIQLNREIGPSISIIEKFRHNLVAPTQYQISALIPDQIELDNEPVLITFELRRSGIVGFFKIQHDEYCLYCKYPQLSLMKSGDIFVMQFPQHLLKLKIIDSKVHRRFVQRLYEAKNQNL